MMQEKKLKIVKYLRKRMLVCAVASWVFTTLILIIEDGGLRELIFLPIGAMALTLVYFKMNAIIKKLETIS